MLNNLTNRLVPKYSIFYLDSDSLKRCASKILNLNEAVVLLGKEYSGRHWNFPLKMNWFCHNLYSMIYLNLIITKWILYCFFTDIILVPDFL